MERGLFDEVDINDLANSEEAIVQPGNITKLEPEDNKVKTPPEDKSQGKGIIITKDDSDDIDLSELENEDEEKKSDEESEDDTKKTKTPATKNDKAAASSSQSVLPSLALVLKEAGVFSSLTDEELAELKDVDGIVKAVEKQIKANELADLTDEEKAYLEARRNGISHTNFIQSKANAEQYKNIPNELIESNDKIQLELIKRSFLVKGLDEKTATKYAQKAVEDEDAVEEAIAARDALVKYEEDSLKDQIEKEKAKTAAKLKDQTEKLEKLKSKVNENSEILPGIKVNSQTKEKIFNSMVTPVKSKENKLLNEVMDLYESDHEYKMKLHALHILTKGFTDFSKFKTTAKSKAVEDLEEKLKYTGSGSIGKTNEKMFGGGATTREIANALPDFRKR